MIRTDVIFVPHFPSTLISRDIPLNSSIEDKIRWANDNSESANAIVEADDQAASLLHCLWIALKRTHEAAALTGMGPICTACERDDAGSCCGPGIENEYDGRLLLVNRLLGVQLPKGHLFQTRCYFLDETGCVLRARQVICVNFLCSNLVGRISGARLAELRVEEGVEQEILFRLHERLTQLSCQY